jgi:Putative Ig domain
MSNHAHLNCGLLLMAESKLRISVWSFGENIQLLPAVVWLIVAQLAAGCAASVSPGTHANPQPGQLVITSDSLPSAKAQTAYSATLTATGGTAPYTWSLSSGSLPIGLSLSSSLGQISGTPSQAGISSFGVQITDSSSPAETAQAQLSLTVAAATTSVQITSSAVPSGQVGSAYSTTLKASGGTAPYSWNVSAGALPGGLSLSTSGTISGTPTASGSFSFTVKVTDSGSPATSASDKFTITIAAAGYSAVLSWTASTSSDVIGYNVYRSTVSGGGYTKINTSLVAGTTYTDSSVVSGQTYYYVTASIDSSGIESLNSNEVQAVIP